MNEDKELIEALAKMYVLERLCLIAMFSGIGLFLFVTIMQAEERYRRDK